MLALLSLSLAAADDDEESRSTEDFIEEIASQGAAVKLVSAAVRAPPPPHRVDYAGISAKSQRWSAVPQQLDLGRVHLITTMVACTILFCALLSCRCWRQYKLRGFLSELPEASDDGTWLVVAFEWGLGKIQSGRMPLEHIVRASMSLPCEPTDSQSPRTAADSWSLVMRVLDAQTSIPELIAAAVDYGAEHVDSEIREDNVAVRYMDSQGVERRVGAKTRFADVARARALRVCRRKLSTITEESANLVASSPRKPVLKVAPSGALDDDDDHSVIT